MNSKPCVLVFAGLDPSGGAGLAADIGAIAAQGAHALPVITVLTVQDNDRVFAVRAIDAKEVAAQAQALLDKIQIRAIKLGIIGSRANADVIASLVRTLRIAQPDLALILDPVLASGHGDALAKEDPLTILQPLLPLASVILPNLPESARLCPQASDVAAQAAHLLQLGCQHVLLKGGHGEGEMVSNRCFSQDGTQHEWQWPRLAGQFHGSGCTLASALAGQIATGVPIYEAMQAAQAYCQQTLATAFAIAAGQKIPQRMLPTKE